MPDRTYGRRLTIQTRAGAKPLRHALRVAQSPQKSDFFKKSDFYNGSNLSTRHLSDFLPQSMGAIPYGGACNFPEEVRALSVIRDRTTSSGK
jgi:hypothetical protein